MSKVVTQSKFIAHTLLWMSLGLVITGLVCYRVVLHSAANPAFALRMNSAWFMIFIIQMFLTMGIAGMYQKSKAGLLGLLYVIYTAINGLWIGPLLFWYDATSVMYAIAATVVSFVVIALVSMVTKKDMTSKDGFIMMSLIGLMVAMMVNWLIYIFSPMAAYTFNWLISIVGVLIFYALLASSMQNLKKIGAGLEQAGETKVTTYAIQGAFSLYLTIINIFMFLLRIFGRRG